MQGDGQSSLPILSDHATETDTALSQLPSNSGLGRSDKQPSYRAPKLSLTFIEGASRLVRRGGGTFENASYPPVLVRPWRESFAPRPRTDASFRAALKVSFVIIVGFEIFVVLFLLIFIFIRMPHLGPSGVFRNLGLAINVCIVDGL